MEILPFHFKTLSYCGLWNENTKFPILKSVYTVVVLTLIFYFTTVQVIEFVRSCNSVEDSMQIMYVCFTFMTLCFKILNFMLRHEEMLSLLKKFRSDICQPNSPEEWTIAVDYNREINKIFVTLMLLAQSSGVAYCLLPLLGREWKNFTVPYKTYQPYKITNSALYCGTYAFQFLAGFYGILMNVSFDTMVYGLFLLICAQYEIFFHRVMQVDDQHGKFSLKKYVDHHVFIQDLISSTQSLFMLVVTPFFFFSLITLGASIFKIFQLESMAEFMTMALYLSGIMFQIFLYCWFGNELTMKNKNVVNAIYNSDWIKLGPLERKGLKIIMQMSAKEIVMSHHGQCSLNLSTFVWILKTSYSALNVLQQSAKE